LKVILASASPRRRELIQLLAIEWETVTASVDESSVHHPEPAADVIQTAELKAMAVAEQVSGARIIVAADTTVAIDGERLNKPADELEARIMLKKLRGRIHQVYTGIVLLNTSTGQMITEIAIIDVPMRDYTNEEIDAYVDSGDPLDKAGAYAIQHPEFQPVSKLAGCYAGVMGLPLCHLTRALRRFDMQLTDAIALRCQQTIQYDCPIYQDILGP
jgi:MAF protein